MSDISHLASCDLERRHVLQDICGSAGCLIFELEARPMLAQSSSVHPAVAQQLWFSAASLCWDWGLGAKISKGCQPEAAQNEHCA
jgi:hypothetical protein